MTHPAWLPTQYDASSTPPTLNAELELDEHPLLKRLNALYQGGNPLAADLFQRALSLDQAGGGAAAHYAQLFRKMPGTSWPEQFAPLVESSVDVLADRLAEPAYDGGLLAWGVGQAFRFNRETLESAPLFNGTEAVDPYAVPETSYTPHGTTAWLYLDQETLEQVVRDLWIRAAYTPPPAPSTTPAGRRGRGKRPVAPKLIGGGAAHVDRIVQGARSTLGDALNADLDWEEDNLYEIRNRLRAGVRAAEDQTVAHVIDMAYATAKTRREHWAEAKDMEVNEEQVLVDPMVEALNDGLFGGNARNQDDYDEDDVVVDEDDVVVDEDDRNEGDLYDADDLHEINVPPNEVEHARRLMQMLQNNPGMSVEDLALALDHAAGVEDEPVPQARALRRRRLQVEKPRLPEVMPIDWGMETWPREAQRFQWAFEAALHDTTRQLRGIYVERLVDWIEQNDGGPTWKLGQRLWGLRLTQSEFNRLDGVRPMAERLLHESPRLALFALRVAPLLGIATVELNLLGAVKKTLHERGVTDAVWKKTIPDLSASWMLDAWGDTLRQAEPRVAECALNLLAWKDKGNLQREDFHLMERLLQDPEAPAVEVLLDALDVSPRDPEPDLDDPDEDLEDDPHVGDLHNNDDDEPHRHHTQGGYLGDAAKPDVPVSEEERQRREQVLEEARAREQVARLARLPSLAKAIVVRLRETSVANFFTNEWPLVSDYLKRSEMGTWQAFPERMTWPMLWRRQQSWHEALLQAQKGKHYRYAWTSALPTFSDGTFVAEPMANGGDLWEEGKVMHHCVSSYARDCKRGTHRIFSIRKGTQRVGTLELVRHRSGGWAIGQFLGYCNTAVSDPDAKKFAKLVRAAYIQAEVQQAIAPLAPSPSSGGPTPRPAMADVPAPANSTSPLTPVDPNTDATEWLTLFKASLAANPPAVDDEPPEDPGPRRPRPGH